MTDQGPAAESLAMAPNAAPDPPSTTIAHSANNDKVPSTNNGHPSDIAAESSGRALDSPSSADAGPGASIDLALEPNDVPDAAMATAQMLEAAAAAAAAAAEAVACPSSNQLPPVQFTPPASGPSVRAYLDSTVVPVLRLALRELVKQRPEDPYEFLSKFILDHRPK